MANRDSANAGEARNGPLIGNRSGSNARRRYAARTAATMRPKEWIKNVFVFAAIAFARNPITGTPLWQERDKVLIVVVAFILFCMAASAIYLINDLVDIEKDRAHPEETPPPAGIRPAEPSGRQARRRRRCC